MNITHVSERALRAKFEAVAAYSAPPNAWPAEGVGFTKLLSPPSKSKVGMGENELPAIPKVKANCNFPL